MNEFHVTPPPEKDFSERLNAHFIGIVLIFKNKFKTYQACMMHCILLSPCRVNYIGLHVPVLIVIFLHMHNSVDLITAMCFGKLNDDHLSASMNRRISPVRQAA